MFCPVNGNNSGARQRISFLCFLRFFVAKRFLLPVPIYHIFFMISIRDTNGSVLARRQ